MMPLPVAQQLWRYEYGRLAPEILAVELRAAIDALGDQAGIHPYSREVAIWNPRLLSEYDLAMTASRTALVGSRFRDAYRNLCNAEGAWKSIQELFEAVAAVRRAEDSSLEVVELARTARLRRLPAVASLGQLVESSRQWIGETRYREALHLAVHCGRIAEALLERRDPDRRERKTIPEQIDAMEELSDATASFADVSDDLVRDGSIASLRELFQRRHIRLGGRLLAELQIQLAGRRRFRLQYERARSLGSPMFESVEETRARVALLSWDGAVDYQWHIAMERYAGALQQQLHQLNDITEESWKI